MATHLPSREKKYGPSELRAAGEQLHEVRVALGVVRGRPPLPVGHVEANALPEEEANRLGVATLGREVRRRPTAGEAIKGATAISGREAHA